MKKKLPTLVGTVRSDAPLLVYIALCVIAFGALVIPARSFQLIGEPFNGADTDEKIVALTFDDGPHEKHLGDVLSTLKDHDARGTFFLIGKEIKDHPLAAVDIVKAGHEVGNHSYTHQSLVFLTPAMLNDEITSTDRLIRSAGYQGEIPFRPPYGHKFIMLPYYLEQQHRPMIMWSLAPDDEYKTAEEMSAYVLREVKPGSIVIMHVMEDHRAESRAALKLLVPALKDLGYRFVTVSELVRSSQ